MKSALELITENKRTKAPFLDLGNCGLTELPDELFDCVWLENLNLGSQYYDEQKRDWQENPNQRKENQLQRLEKIGLLKKLRILSFSTNKVFDLLPLKELINLEILNFGDNTVSDISPLQESVHLQKLYFYKNVVTNILPLKGLINLRSLVFWKNQVSDLSPLKELVNLQNLNFQKNQVSELPLKDLLNLQHLNFSGNQISDLFPLCILKNLKKVYALNNPISSLPKEVLNLDLPILWNKTIRNEKNGCYFGNNPFPEPLIAAIKGGQEALENYFKQTEEQGQKYLFEAKILLLGEGGAGKTSFTRKIQNPDAPLPTPEESTHGIETHQWTFTVDPHSCGKELKAWENKTETTFFANIWDLGGQEIYKGTHQFFFSDKILYVLVLNTRKGIGEIPLHYWFQTVAQRGTHSKVLVIVNEEGGQSGKGLNLQSRLHTFDYEGIKEIDLSKTTKIPSLQTQIQELLIQLPEIGDPVPAYWLPIREALAQESRTKNFISWDRLREICHENQLTQEADIETMAGIFHRLGVFTYYAEDEWLEDRVFLNSNWLCSTVYRLLDNRNVKDEYKGRLTKEQFREIWQENELFKETAKLIRLLERFGLVYQAENQYIIPMLLPESPAVFIADQRSENALYFVYRFDNYMPKGLLPRLMVGLHHHIKDHTLVWRYGFGVAYGKAQAEIREESENNGGKRNEIWIQLIGKNENRAYLLTVIRSFFEEKILKADFPNMKYEKRVACACVVCEKEKVENKAWYDYDKLKKRKENPSPKAQNVQCEESLETLSVSFLLGLVEKPQNFEKTQKEAIFEAIEEADWAKAFELADKLLEMKNTKSPKYAKLKKKFILGKPDEDFADQIIVFVRNL